MLIQKIIGKNKVEDYCFLNYENEETKQSVKTLALFKGHGIYEDLLNNTDVYFKQILNKELLIFYADVKDKWLSKNAAKKLAKPYYQAFEQDILKQNELTAL